MFGVFGLCLGWPKHQVGSDIKPRLRPETVWHRNRYRPEPLLDEYDARMAAHFGSRGQSADVTWTMRSARRTDEHHLTGRQVLKRWLEDQGFNLR